MATRDKRVQISFDDLNRIRILDPEHFKQTEGLADECTQFNDSQNDTRDRRDCFRCDKRPLHSERRRRIAAATLELVKREVVLREMRHHGCLGALK